MSWFLGNAAARPRPEPVRAAIALTPELEASIAAFLVKQGRLEERPGRYLLHVTATTSNVDGTNDYVVRTRVQAAEGRREFNSHVRVFPDGRIRLIR